LKVTGAGHFFPLATMPKSLRLVWRRLLGLRASELYGIFVHLIGGNNKSKTPIGALLALQQSLGAQTFLTQHGDAVLTKIVRGDANNFPSSITGKSRRSRRAKPTRCSIGARKRLSLVRRGSFEVRFTGGAPINCLLP
jgi:hypothetical protein